MLAFKELSRERRVMPGTVLPIEGSAIKQWARDNDLISDDDFMYELTEHVRALDKFWVGNELKKIDKANKRGNRDARTTKLREKDARLVGRHKEASERD